MTMSGKGRARLFRIFATAVLGAGLAAAYAAASPGSSAAVRTAAVSTAATFSLGYPATQQTEPDSQASLQMPYSEPDKDATIAFTAAGLPPGLSIDSATGLISGTTGSKIASYTVTVSATDSTGKSSTRSFTWNVWNKITLTAPTREQSFVGKPVDVSVAAADSAPGVTVTLSAANLPHGLSLDPATGVISGTPASLSEGYVTVTATDGTGSAGTIDIGWFVGGVLSLGVVAAQTTVVGQPADLSLALHDNAAGDYISYGALGLPPGLKSGGLSPAISGSATTPGTYHVTATAQGLYGGTASESFTWTVRPASGAGPTGSVRMGADDKCIDDTGNSSANGNKIQIWTCNAGAAQSWTYAEDSTLRIHGKCLAATGSKILLSTCTGAASQRWAVYSDAQLVNQVTGLCLHDPDTTGKKNGIQLAAMGCSNTSNGTENWALPAGPILSGLAGRCLDDYLGSTKTGAEVDLAPCNGSSRQAWTYEPGSTVRIFGLCLTRNSANGTMWSHVTLQKCGTAESQQWDAVAAYEFGYELMAPGGVLGAPGNLNSTPVLVQLDKQGAMGTYWDIW
jgi:Ricin-type beta-trefoil lectin domain/Putative Ig domain